jgi:hypothetical protein
VDSLDLRVFFKLSQKSEKVKEIFLQNQSAKYYLEPYVYEAFLFIVVTRQEIYKDFKAVFGDTLSRFNG